MFDLDLLGSRVLVVGHADGDGHLAAEQSRRNALTLGASGVEVLVDPAITSGYRYWEKSLDALRLDRTDVVIFVDLMLSPSEPAKSLASVSTLAEGYADKVFWLIDHHPVAHLNKTPGNLTVRFTDQVFNCCYGPPSELMLIASICDQDERPVADLLEARHRRLARAINRAASDTRGLAGKGLSSLLANERWDLLEALACESDEFHRTVRGRRVRSQPVTQALAAARNAATNSTRRECRS